MGTWLLPSRWYIIGSLMGNKATSPSMVKTKKSMAVCFIQYWFHRSICSLNLHSLYWPIVPMNSNVEILKLMINNRKYNRYNLIQIYLLSKFNNNLGVVNIKQKSSVSGEKRKLLFWFTLFFELSLVQIWSSFFHLVGHL